MRALITGFYAITKNIRDLGEAGAQATNGFNRLAVIVSNAQREWVAAQLVKEGWTPWVARLRARWLPEGEKVRLTDIWLEENSLMTPEELDKLYTLSPRRLKGITTEKRIGHWLK